MLANVKKKVIQHKINKLLSQYGVKVLHRTPGRVRLKIEGWQQHEELFQKLLQEVKEDAAVESVQFTAETGSILIYYMENAHKDHETQQRWLAIGNDYFAEQVGSE